MPYYQINIATKDGNHLFATASHSLTSRIDYDKVLPLIIDKFPESEGYRVTASYYTLSGQPRDIDADLTEAEIVKGVKR